MTTFVSAFYNIQKYGNIQVYSKELVSYFHHIEFLMSVPGPLVIYTEDEFLQRIVEAKNKYRQNMITEIIIKKWEDLYWVSRFSEINRLAKNKGRYAHDDTPEFIPIMWEKILFVNHAIQENKYNSKFFAWIDFGLGRIDHYRGIWPRDLTIDDKSKHFQINKEKIRFMVSNVQVFEENLYFDDLGTSLCAGGYITGSGEYFIKLKNIFLEECSRCLSIGCVPREETILVKLLTTNPEIFDIYYGDSNECMLANYDEYYFYDYLTEYNLNRLKDFGNFDRISDIKKKILEAFSLGKSNITKEELKDLILTNK